jgi:hypothetical protein
MPVRYCLGIQHNDVAGAIDPGAGPFHLDPLREQLKRLVPELTFGELQHVPSFAWTNKKLATHVLTQLRFTGHDEAQRFHEALEKRLTAPDRKPIYGFGPDPPIHALEAWSPIGSGGGIFSDRDRAERRCRTARQVQPAGDRQGRQRRHRRSRTVSQRRAGHHRPDGGAARIAAGSQAARPRLDPP